MSERKTDAKDQSRPAEKCRMNLGRGVAHAVRSKSGDPRAFRLDPQKDGQR